MYVCLHMNLNQDYRTICPESIIHFLNGFSKFDDLLLFCKLCPNMPLIKIVVYFVFLIMKTKYLSFFKPFSDVKQFIFPPPPPISQQKNANMFTLLVPTFWCHGAQEKNLAPHLYWRPIIPS